MNRDHSYYPYNNNEQPLEVEWQAPEQNDIAGNTQWNGSTYHGSYQNHNRYSGGSGEPPKQKPPKKPGPVRRVGRVAGSTAHGFVHGKIYENEHENVGKLSVVQEHVW